MENFFKHPFKEEEKQELINHALTTSSQILMTAVVLCGAENFITGRCTFPDGSEWTLTFLKSAPNQPKVESESL